MNYLIYLPFGVLPSIIWLGFYLRKDSHPESNLMILKIFFYGMLAALPSALLEMGILGELNKLGLSEILTIILYFFFGVALVEEGIKYLVVRDKVLNNLEFDEPTDAMLYMIIAALGFATLENILVLFSLGDSSHPLTIFWVTGFRFVGATFLHALASGTIGYFLAISIFSKKRKEGLIILGLAISTILHGLYNFSIMELSPFLKLLVPFAILVVLAIFVSWGFNRLKKLKSVCLS